MLMFIQVALERFSIECRENKTKVITLAYHKKTRRYGEPIKTQLHVADAKRGKARVTESTLVLVLLLIG